MGILPAFFVEIKNFNERLLISAISLLPLGFLVADIFNYFKAKNGLKKNL